MKRLIGWRSQVDWRRLKDSKEKGKEIKWKEKDPSIFHLRRVRIFGLFFFKISSGSSFSFIWPFFLKKFVLRYKVVVYGHLGDCDTIWEGFSPFSVTASMLKKGKKQKKKRVYMYLVYLSWKNYGHFEIVN